MGDSHLGSTGIAEGIYWVEQILALKKEGGEAVLTPLEGN